LATKRKSLKNPKNSYRKPYPSNADITHEGRSLPVETNRSLGGIGSVLSFLGIISTIITLADYAITGLSPTNSLATLGFLGAAGIFGFIAFVGFILFLVAMYGFSRDYGERRIFSYILYGIIGAIITAVVVGIASLLISLGTLFSPFQTTNPPQSTAIQQTSIITSSVSTIVSLVWVFFVIKSYNLLSEKAGVSLFKVGARVLLVSAILNVVMAAIFIALAFSGEIDFNTYILALLPGGILGYAAQGLFAISFFRIKPPTQPYVQTNAWQNQVRYCSNCGTANQLDSVYCTKCGQKL
jgi:uncharacterized membrane protein